MPERMRVLITVKTQPLPSDKYLEVVCTAGMREDGSFVRLYPVDYRYRPYWQWYSKYQWIDLEAERHDTTKDSRRESYRPVLDSIKPIGFVLPTLDGWQARKQIVLAQPPETIERLRALQNEDGTSLGLTKPRQISDLVIEPDEEYWKPKWQADMNQLRLFGPDRKPLEKVPYKFSYRFTCDDPKCRGHKMMIADWEVAELYRKMHKQTGDNHGAAQSVRAKFLEDICGPTRDVHFFVGTVLRFGTWIVLGVFYPPKADPKPIQTSLFGN